ncbi:MAG: serine/threonine-protein phosphatase, partial [Bacteroidales bacterium]|nr:serine/threonine-protein phosphatase [Bacteroidales bacterium]
NNFLIIAAVDCTGHGVPGAFMSMLGTSFLNETVTKTKFDKPNEILERLRKKVKISLKQTGKDIEQRDGMDMALCILDLDNKEMQYAGAYNPLYLIRNGELIEYKADRQPVAIHYVEKEFTNHVIKLQEGDALYIFSDGFYDQLGGTKYKKFLSKNFKSLLLEINKKSMEQQKDLLDKTLKEWMKDYEQIDDILVIGIRV